MNAGREIKRSLLSILILFSMIPFVAGQDQDLKVLSTQGKTWLRFSNSHQALNLHLMDEAEKLFSEREQLVAGIKSLAELKSRQRDVKEVLNELMRPKGKNTPLNATITKTSKKDGFTMELVVFESAPGFYVTGTLLIPDGLDKPGPAVLFCSGHSAPAYRRDIYQIPLLNLVKKGFVVFAIDPLGQGERLQYFDPNRGESVIGSSTKEHSYPMVQTALTGRSVAEYFALDGMRAIDYLVSRAEVDPSRIGVHGLSGGGTQTAYIAALDERVKAAAPSGYITNYRRLFESIGVQDGEQNLYRGLFNGVDHPELLLARAPKPTLIMATTRDFFSIEGTRETYEEVAGYYDLFGHPDNLSLVEGDYGHGYTKNIREAMYAFFQEHLENPGDSEEEEVDLLEEEEIKITTTGQVSTALNAKNIFDLNRENASVYLDGLKKARQNPKAYLSRVPELARDLSGYQTPEKVDKPFFMGRLQREGYSIEKYFIDGEGNYAIPYLLFNPENDNGEVVLYLHPEGKHLEADEDGEIEKLVDRGFAVLAPDLLGIGEQQALETRGDANIEGVSLNAWFSGMTIGRSLVGIQAGDISRLVQVLKEEGYGEVHGVARDQMGPILLHAAALNELIGSVALIGSYTSYESIVLNEFYNTDYVHSMVPGALLAYDLPDLAASLAPKKLMMVDMRNEKGDRMSEGDLAKALSYLHQAYQSVGKSNQLVVETNASDESPMELVTGFIEK